MILYSNISIATDNNIIDLQMNNIKINEFTKEVNKYTKEVFSDMDAESLLNLAIQGKLNNKGILSSIGDLFLKEIKMTIGTMISILIIIVIHSIFKSISDNFGKEQVGQIAFYVQYILIITVIMMNFADIILMVKNAISDIIIFMHTLIPILISLIISTGNITVGSVVQPLIIFLIQFIGNLINTVVIPFILIGTILGIVSNISDRVQISKLAGIFKTSTIWIIRNSIDSFCGSFIYRRNFG